MWSHVDEGEGEEILSGDRGAAAAHSASFP